MTLIERFLFVLIIVMAGFYRLLKEQFDYAHGANIGMEYFLEYILILIVAFSVADYALKKFGGKEDKAKDGSHE